MLLWQRVLYESIGFLVKKKTVKNYILKPDTLTLFYSQNRVFGLEMHFFDKKMCMNRFIVLTTTDGCSVHVIRVNGLTPAQSVRNKSGGKLAYRCLILCLYSLFVAERVVS